MTDPWAIEAAGLAKVYGDRAALRRLDLQVAAGERILLLGPNGAGKTTLLRLFGLFLRPSAGRLRIAGRDPFREGIPLRQGIGYLGHGGALYPDLTVEENLAFYARLFQVEGADRRIAGLLDRFGLSDRRDTRTRTLSRGLQQRLALARTVLHDPPLLLLDEPDTGLDAAGRDLLADLIAEGGRTVFLSTHNPAWAERLMDRTLVLNGGRLVEDTARSAAGTRPGLGAGGRTAESRPASPEAPRSNEPIYSPTPSQLTAGSGVGAAVLAPARSPDGPPRPAQAPERRHAPGLGAFFGQAWAILWKDLLLEARRRELLGMMGIFVLLVLVIFTFALDLAAEYAPVVAPGALWIAFIFAGTLGLGRAFATEGEWGTLDGLLGAPVPRGAIYLAKVAGNVLFLLAIEALSVPVFIAFFNLPLAQPLLPVILLLGTVGFGAVATLFAALAANTRAREVLLPVLLFPVVLPVVIAGVEATSGILTDAGTGPWLNVLLAFDVIFLTVAFVTFEYVLED